MLKRLIPGLEQGKFKINLGHFMVPESKEVPKGSYWCIKNIMMAIFYTIWNKKGNRESIMTAKTKMAGGEKEKCQVAYILIERMIELQNHHLASPKEIIDLDKTIKECLKVVEEQAISKVYLWGFVCVCVFVMYQ